MDAMKFIYLKLLLNAGQREDVICVVYEYDGNAGFDAEWDIIRRREIKRGNG
jgi:hypothetical protein